MQPALIYAEVCKDLKNNPLRPNRLSKQIEAHERKFAARLQALKQLAQGD